MTMQSKPAHLKPSQLTVLIFKDNFSARTFQIPLRWINRFGLLIGLMLFVTGLSLTLIVKNYTSLTWQWFGGQPLSQNQRPAHQSQDGNRAVEDSNPAAADSVAINLDEILKEDSASEPTENSTQASQPDFLLFRALPAESEVLVNQEDVPIDLQDLKVDWKGNTLRVRFNIHYLKKDGGSQSGRILMIARGPQALLAYPSGVINPTGANSVLNPLKGEYFSLRRIRQANADFPSISSREQIKDVEILIFSNEGQLMIRELVQIERKGNDEPQQ